MRLPLTKRNSFACCFYGMLVVALLLFSPRAKADVQPGTITYLYLNLPSSGQGSTALQSQYSSMILSLRNAAGHPYRNGVDITQLQHTTGLIRLRIYTGGVYVDLWYTPQDLYLRGFTNTYGYTYQFSDSDYNLLSALDILGDNSGQGGSTLPFASDYNSLRQAAGRGRESTPFNYTSFWNSIFNLAYTTSPTGSAQQNVARSLTLMIQMTSEAARFNDVYGVAQDAMFQGSYSGLPAFQQYLENNWATISNFGLTISQNGTANPTTVQGINPNTGNSPTAGGQPYTLYSFNDVQRFLAIMCTAPYDSDTGGISQDWNHSEL